MVVFPSLSLMTVTSLSDSRLSSDGDRMSKAEAGLNISSLLTRDEAGLGKPGIGGKRPAA